MVLLLFSRNCLSTWSQIWNVPSEFTVWTIRLVILTIFILNLLLSLTGIHIVLHVFSGPCQEACGFVHYLILTHLTFFLVLEVLSLTNWHISFDRLSSEATRWSSLWVVLAIALCSLFNILLVVVLTIVHVILVWMILHDLWL